MRRRPLRAALAVDIGGTFTDVVLRVEGQQQCACKVLTTPHAPEQGVIQGIKEILALAGLRSSQVSHFILGTTLATNALIERKGARTAFIATEGFTDLVQIGQENRFAQYDIFLDKPEPLVPRHLRFGVPERVNVRGEVLLPLDEQAVERLAGTLADERVGSVAVALLHSYVNPHHERRIREILKRALPDLWITLSSDVCPEIREFERMSTACANAYVQPVVAGYLLRLQDRLTDMGLDCPFFLMTSGGAITTVDRGAEQPVRLVESGPAGGAIMAQQVARQCGIERALSFDMGGTTAKICFIDDYEPELTRSFEFGRVYRFLKGSGLPIRIPVIEMVEIGAGGGSIARVDELQRVQVGPDSAASDPGPACYGLGGTLPTVTDANAVMGLLDPERFAGGKVRLEVGRAEQAVHREIAKPLQVDLVLGALAISEIVTENMANAARVHAMELGKTPEHYTLIAFGGAAPLHATQLARKLGIKRVIVPVAASVGSALGFLWAPAAFQAVRSFYQHLERLDLRAVNALLQEMTAEAETVVRKAAPSKPLRSHRVGYMRYVGQGHEIPVRLPDGELRAGCERDMKRRFEESYRTLYGRTIPNLAVEVISWAATVSTRALPVSKSRSGTKARAAKPVAKKKVFELGGLKLRDVPVYDRVSLAPGDRINGPALIVEDQTTTVVGADFGARIDSLGYIVLERRGRNGK